MWQGCQNGVSRFAPVLLLALVACAAAYAQDVRTNYMPGTDFSKYHTYAWVSQVQGVPTVGVHPDQILDAQVKQAIDSQMAAKGFAEVQDAGKADLLLGYQLAIDQEKQINGFGDSWGGWGGWGPWGPGGNTFGTFSASTSSNYIGTFVVGMYDPAVNLCRDRWPSSRAMLAECSGELCGDLVRCHSLNMPTFERVHQ